jgi:hypothetical protein
VTGRSLLDLNFQGMGIVTLDTGIELIDVSKISVVGLAFILIPTISYCAVLRSSGGIVVDI